MNHHSKEEFTISVGNWTKLLEINNSFVQVNHHSKEEFTISVGNWNSGGQHP